MARVLTTPDLYIGRSFVNIKGNAECVEFIQQVLHAPVTAAWKEGAKIKRLNPGEKDLVARGTAIATFVAGKYPQHGSSGMHAAVYLGQNSEGIQVLDQWRAQGKILPRTIPWKARRHGLSNDGNAYSMIE